MLAEARTLDELRQVRDIAIAAAAYARAHRLGDEAQKYAVEIVAIASRRMAELQPPVPPQASGALGGRGRKASAPADTFPARQRRSENRDLLALTEDEVREEVRHAKAPSLSAVRRKARTVRAGRVRAEKMQRIVPTPGCDIRLGDFRDVLADVADGSVDVILTDPPYPAEYLSLWTDLAVFAKRVLKPDGLLVAMSGQMHLPQVIDRLGEYLPYRWTMAYLTPGATYRAHARNVTSAWKPVLVYGSSARGIHDIARSDAEDKDHHGWGQSESGISALLRASADPGAVVCDPFLGGGTTALVALDYRCSFVGAEIEREAYEVALVRMQP